MYFVYYSRVILQFLDFEKNKTFSIAIEWQNKRMTIETGDFRKMQDVKPLHAVSLQSCINLYSSTHDKDLQTSTAQNTTK